MKRLDIVVVLTLLISVLEGCALFKETGPGKGGAVGTERAGATTKGIGLDGVYPGVETSGIEGPAKRYDGETPWNEPDNPLADKIIYFEFDSSTVQPAYNNLIAIHAEYLAAHPELNVTLEGHADERGTREYNIALGEQRAIAVSRIMKLQGVGDSQIEVVSYGEEKPQAFEHNEHACSLNRRVEIKYPK